MKRILFICIVLFIHVRVIGQSNKILTDVNNNQNNSKIDSIAKTLNYKGGEKVKVYAKFSVNENGEISNIEAKGPHVLFEQEAIRLVRMIPKLDPPKNLPIGKKEITFLLPISFVIETDKDRMKRERKEKRKMEKEKRKRERKRKKDKN